MSNFYYSFIYWRLRNMMKWFSSKTKLQCHGKRHIGTVGALEWCQKKAFHEGVCVSAQGIDF